jgi:transcriptional regulator with XRE-family HTH domain
MENELAIKIKRLRLEKGMTLEQVASIVGVGKSTVRKWETGMIANMGRDKIARLATALSTTPAYLMGWEEDIEQTLTLNEPKLTEGEEMLLNLFRQIPEDAQKMYLEVLRASLKNQS